MPLQYQAFNFLLLKLIGHPFIRAVLDQPEAYKKNGICTELKTDIWKKNFSREETARNRQEDERISAWLFRGALDLAVDAKRYRLDC